MSDVMIFKCHTTGSCDRTRTSVGRRRQRWTHWERYLSLLHAENWRKRAEKWSPLAVEEIRYES